ncbi:MAG: hypothetical protein BHV81_06185 [Butyricimonas synergistica]|nr:MAG: hypothetical protein BHV81_06185 [Butyricimonas synergistica]
MKRLIIISLLLSFVGAGVSAQEKEFVIKGQIPGMKDGIHVSLLTAETVSSEVIVETTVKNGCFELRGRVESPMLCTLITNNLALVSGLDETEKIRWTYTPVFVDNVEMTVETVHYDSIPFSDPITPCFKITGGEVQEDFNTYNLSIVRDKESKEKQWEFILSHPHSVISAYLGNIMMRGGYELTREEVEKLEKAIVSLPADPVRFKVFRKNCEYAKQTVKNSAIVNLALNDVEGKACNLSEVIPQGKYLLVDFWATWCGPCMAAIPNVKKLVERFPDTFAVIGVSCDTNLKAWKAAIEREKATWPQYVLSKEGYKDFLTKYQTGGVPYFLILDKEGKVISNPGGIGDVEREVERLCK